MQKKVSETDKMYDMPLMKKKQQSPLQTILSCDTFPY